MGRLTGKTAVVTGASSGMGKEIVKLFAQEGANVIAVARRLERLQELADSLEGRGLTITWDGSVKDYLVDKAYSVVYGARNLRRTIQKELEDPISERIIDSFEAPISQISVRVENESIVVDAQ